jgi:hypothetical protein
VKTERKKAGVAILIYDKVDVKPKLVRRDKEVHYILIKGSVHQEGILGKFICTKCWCIFHKTNNNST